MIKYTMRHNWREYIEKKLRDEKLNKRTYGEYKKSQYVGLAGELCFGRYLNDAGIDFEYCGDRSFDFDFSVGDTFIDVKSRPSKTVPFKDRDCTIADYLKFQRTDIYVFAAVCEKEIYLIGWEHKDRFWNSEYAINYKAGDELRGGLIREDCTTVKANHLAPMESLLTFLSVKNEDSPL